MKRLRFSSSVVAALAAFGCVKKQSGSEIQHTAGNPVQFSESWRWVEMTPEKYQSVLKGTPDGESRLLPENHPATQRIQAWIDAIDTYLRATYPEKLKPVPKPVARLLVSGDANAYATRAPVCFQIPAQVEGTGSPSASGSALSLSADGSLQARALAKCANLTPRDRKFDEILSWMNQAQKKCRAISSPQGVILGTGCTPVDQETAETGKTDVTSFEVTSNNITIFTGLIHSLNDEGSLVGIIAHELAHYYLAHATAPAEGAYNYFYLMGSNNGARKPLADPSAAALGERLKRFSSLPVSYRVPQQRISGAAYSWIKMKVLPKVTEYCSTSECSNVCAEARDLVRSPTYKSAVGSFPLQPMPESGLSHFAGFQEKMISCSSQIAIVDNATAKGFPATKVADFLNDRWQSFDVPNPLPRLATLAEVITFANGLVDKRDEEMQAVFKQASQTGLGLYTIEQEADDLMLELTSAFGIANEAAVAAMFVFGEHDERDGKHAGSFDLSMAQCRDLRRLGWKSNGQPAYVPLGELGDPHHGTCYRIYNIDREIAAHRYEKSPSARTPEFSESYATFKNKVP